MIVPTLNTVPTGIGRLMSPALPAVDAVRAVRPVGPGVERGLDKTGRRDRARTSLRARMASGLDALLGPAQPEDGIEGRAGSPGDDTRPGLGGFVDTLETALLALADADAEAAGTEADRQKLLLRLAYAKHDDGFAHLLERLGLDGIAREIPALGPVLAELAARFGQLAAAAPGAGGTPPTLARLLSTVAEQRGDLVSAEA